jgi:hypothetical protein
MGKPLFQFGPKPLCSSLPNHLLLSLSTCTSTCVVAPSPSTCAAAHWGFFPNPHPPLSPSIRGVGGVRREEFEPLGEGRSWRRLKLCDSLSSARARSAPPTYAAEDRRRHLKLQPFMGAVARAVKTKSSVEPPVMKLRRSCSASHCPEPSRVAVPSSLPS